MDGTTTRSSRVALDFPRLARQLGMTTSALEGARALIGQYTRCVVPKKRAGTVRHLSVPSPELKKLQKRIHNRILRNAAVQTCVHGSVRGRGPRTHVEAHCRARAMFMLDLKDAFTQVRWEDVLVVFLNQNYLYDVASFLADLTTHDAVLPQGAPTSNMIWNLVCNHLDKQLLAIAEEEELIYTRYTDELVFSASWYTSIPGEIQEKIQRIIADTGFIVNLSKVHSFSARQGAIPLSGMMIANGRIGLAKQKIDRIRGIVHRARFDYTIPRLRVVGLIAYARHVYGGRLPRRLRRGVNEFLRLRDGIP